MKLGIGSYAYAWEVGIPGYPPSTPMDLLAFVRRSAEAGVGLVQIADNLPLDGLSSIELDTLQKETRRLNMDVEMGTRGIQAEHLRAYLRYADCFQSPILRVVMDTATHHPPEAEIVATLRLLMPEFEAARVILAIENHDRFKAETLANIIEQIESEFVGICLDTTNSLGAGEGIETVVNSLGEYVVNLHVKDFSIRRQSHNLGFIVEGQPAGKGQLDILWLLERLRSYGRDFNAIIELWPPPEATVEDTIRKEQQWVLESVRYLREFIPE